MERPRDHEGKFIPLQCPIACCDGTLEQDYPGCGTWECHGLVDPDNEDEELQACTYKFFDRDHYEWWLWDENGKSKS